MPNEKASTTDLSRATRFRSFARLALCATALSHVVVSTDRTTMAQEGRDNQTIQSQSGDLPASPWSKRNEATQTDRGQEPTNRNIRRPPNTTAANTTADHGNRRKAPLAKVSWGTIREIDPRTELQTKNQTGGVSGYSERNEPTVKPTPVKRSTDVRDQPKSIELIGPGGQEESCESNDVDRRLNLEASREGDRADSSDTGKSVRVRNTSVSRSSTDDQAEFFQDFSSKSPTPPGSEQQVVADLTQSATLGRAKETQPLLQEAERLRVAQMQSHLLQSIPITPAFTPPQMLETPIGWKAIREELAKHLEQCDILLKRGATHSARSEVLTGLRKLFRTMDLYRGMPLSENAFESALIAMREEADFHNALAARSIPTIIATHTTTALKNRPVEMVTAELASQHYRAYARYQLVQAADGHLYAADLYYGLGKTLEREAEIDAEKSQRIRSQAVICYQAALQVRPNQSHANNQLGYALIHLDRIEEAYDALRASIQVQPNAAAWNNLAEIYRRRGAVTEANYAVQQAMSLAATKSGDEIEITQVDPAVFAKYSPALNANEGSLSSANTTNLARSNAAPPNSSVTAKAGSFFSKMFR